MGLNNNINKFELVMEESATSMFDSLKNKFQLRFKNREFAAKILTGGALEDSLKKLKIDKINDQLLILGIPRGGGLWPTLSHQKYLITWSLKLYYLGS